MNKKSRMISDYDLAVFFLEKVDKDVIIQEIFQLFGMDCMVRCCIDSGKLDDLILQFEKEEHTDLTKSQVTEKSENVQKQEIELLTQIIELIRTGKDSFEKRETDLLEEIKDYIILHLAEEISVQEIAAAFHISYHYLCHFFKMQTGMSLGSFRQQKRMEAALRELSTTDKKISDIASECGFNSSSYFTEQFTKLTGMPPKEFRKQTENVCVHDFYTYEDILLAAKYESVSFMADKIEILDDEAVESVVVCEPDEQFGFLHEAAIIEYEGVLYASWYHNPKAELQGYTPICGKRSFDGGKTWTELEILAEDPTEKILYCPPVYGICDGRLYMFVNQMVAPDHMHALDLYVLNRESGKFEFLWSRPIPFKLNTNVVKLPNGKLMLPGRVAELDCFPNTPAVMISDSGKIDAEWRLVKVAENGDLADGTRLVHPEISAICHEDVLYLFSRNDLRNVPLVYVSKDQGETWSPAMSHDIPYRSSKIYSGTLSDGRNYLIANVDAQDRSKLVVYFTGKDTIQFEKCIVLYDREHIEDYSDMQEVFTCHYPAACESDGKLYIIATKGYKEWGHRGAQLYIVDMKRV